MDTNSKRFTRFLPYIFLMLILGLSISFCHFESQAASKTVKIRYNGRTYKNKSKKLTVKYNNKTVSQKSYKALIIKKQYMVPYTHVFKKGVKASCKYTKKNKKLTISANGQTLTMTVGKKKAYLNGKKVTLPVAPLSVRYVSKKKTLILVPINYVAKKLNLSYKKTTNAICLGEPLTLYYDGKTTYYTGVQGSVYYNHKTNPLSSLPVIKLSGTMYMPAEEVLSSVMKLDYTYQASNGQIKIDNEDTNIHFQTTIHSTKAKINGKDITLSAPAKIIRNQKTKKDVVCIPAATVLKQLNYTRSWNKTKSYYQIQSKVFFDWKKDLKDTQSTSETNHLHEFKSLYMDQNGTGSITFQLTGTQTASLKSATVNRTGNTISITIPKSTYVIDKKMFAKFGEIIQNMEVTEKDSTVALRFVCENVADYSYIIQNQTLQINILYTYGSSDGSVTSYSLAIPKPTGVSIANVTNQDLYQSKKFQILISGDHVAFFQSHPIVINNRSIKNIAVSKNNTHTIITIATNSLMGYKIYENGDNLQVKIGTPRNIYKNILVLDAGHGGHDPGAQNKGTNEKDLTHKILYTLMKDYFSSNAPDIKVYWTRTNDTFISLADRAAFAKSVGADAFISLHMNSATNTLANGTEVYYSVSNNSSSFGGITSQKMANLFRTQIINDLGTKNRGTKTAAYYVLKHNTVPAILIELGFISGNSDYGKLTNTAFQINAAQSIYTGITTMFQTYQTGR